VKTFKKVDEEATKKKQMLTPLQNRAIKQASGYSTKLNKVAAEKRKAALDKQEQLRGAQKKRISASVSSGVTNDNGARHQDPSSSATLGLGSPRPTIPPNGDATITASRQPKKPRYEDHVSGGGGTDLLDNTMERLFQHICPPGDGDDSPSRRAASPTGELLKCLESKLGRLRTSRKDAFDVSQDEEVKDYSKKIKVVEKEIDDIENVMLDQARGNAAAATAADNH
jgi:hypothetical protein